MSRSLPKLLILNALVAVSALAQTAQNNPSQTGFNKLDTVWQNWDQGKAFSDAQARIAAGKDPIPDARDCFWRYGPMSGDPHINIAYPDAKAVYWGANFTIPAGAKMHLEGKYPHARYASLISYDFKGAPLESVADYLLKPLEGHTNPFLDGADRTAANRSYRLEVVNAPLLNPMRWGVYLAGETRDKIHAPAPTETPQQKLIYRIYATDKGVDITGNVGLPQPVLTLADGRMVKGQQACQALRTAQPMQGDPGALATPRTELRAMIDESKKKLGPAAPAVNPPLWLRTSETMSRFAIYTHDMTAQEGVRRTAGAFYPNLDNEYVRAFVNRKFGDVFVLRAKAPTTPKTYHNNAKWSNTGELRYWSWCSNEGFGTARVVECIHDEQLPVDAQGFYTLVVSRASDRPRNATRACGVSWLPMADVGDGTGETDLTMLVMRQMLGVESFKEAIANNKSQADIAKDMGAYFPRGRYTSVAAFETAVPCLFERRN